MAIPDEAIKNDAGQVAIKWVLNRMPKPVVIQGTDQYYIFTYRTHVAMAWINPEHVERVLGTREKTCNCNNGTYQNAFALANQLDVNLWETGTREGIKK